MRRVRLGTGGLSVLFISAISGVLAQPVNTLQPVQFSESLRDQVPVAGDVVRGLWLAPGPKKVALARLHVHTPPGPAARLCMLVESQDGKYLGEGEYTVGARTVQEAVHLILPTQHRRVLEDFEPSALAVRVALAAACDDPGSTLLPVSWSGSSGTGNLVVQLSSGGAGVSAELYDVASNRYVKCTQANYLSIRAFNRECKDADGGRRGSLTLFVLRERGVKKLENVEFKVFMP